MPIMRGTEGFSTRCPPAPYMTEGHCARGQRVEKPPAQPLEAAHDGGK